MERHTHTHTHIHTHTHTHIYIMTIKRNGVLTYSYSYTYTVCKYYIPRAYMYYRVILAFVAFFTYQLSSRGCTRTHKVISLKKLIGR